MDVERLVAAIVHDTAEPSTYTVLPVMGRAVSHVNDNSRTLVAVRSETEIMSRVGKMLKLGNSSSLIDEWIFASWLIDRGRTSDARTAIRELDAFLADPCYHVIQVLLVSGAIVTQTVEVLDGIFFGPCAQVPSENLKAEMAAEPKMQEFLSRIGMLSAFRPPEGRPGCAFWRAVTAAPKWLDAVGDETDGLGAEPLYILSTLLTLIGPCPASPSRHWTEPVTGTPLKIHVGRGWGHSVEQTRVLQTIALAKPEIDLFPSVVQSFFRLREDVRRELLVSIHRLNQAVRHTDPVERAIDLGIALEALLLSDADEKTQLTLQFRLRGAWLLGSSAVERLELSNKLKELYACRSKAVHAGIIGTKPGDVQKRIALLNEGLTICRRAILAVIERGGFPDWNSLVLGG